jgi:ABC-type transporter Mla MlaB component
MLRILVFEEPFSVKLRLEGELTGQTAPQLTQRWAEVRSRLRDRKAILDLGDVVRMDEAGRDTLAWLTEAGVRIGYAHPRLQSLIEDLACAQRGAEIRKRLSVRDSEQGLDGPVYRAWRLLCSILPSRLRPCGCRANVPAADRPLPTALR